MKKKHSASLVTAATELLDTIEPEHPRQPAPAATTAAASLARLLDSEQYNGKATLSLLEAASNASTRAVDAQAATAASFQAVLAALRGQGQSVYRDFIQRS